MTVLQSGVRVLSFDDPVLSARAVTQLEASLREAEANGHAAAATVLDCHKLQRVTPAGLSALLELGQRATQDRALALAALSRPLTLAAVQAGLAAHFAIYTSVAAFARARRRPELGSCAR